MSALMATVVYLETMPNPDCERAEAELAATRATVAPLATARSNVEMQEHTECDSGGTPYLTWLARGSAAEELAPFRRAGWTASPTSPSSGDAISVELIQDEFTYRVSADDRKVEAARSASAERLTGER